MTTLPGLLSRPLSVFFFFSRKSWKVKKGLVLQVTFIFYSPDLILFMKIFCVWVFVPCALRLYKSISFESLWWNKSVFPWKTELIFYFLLKGLGGMYRVKYSDLTSPKISHKDHRHNHFCMYIYHNVESIFVVYCFLFSFYLPKSPASEVIQDFGYAGSLILSLIWKLAYLWLLIIFSFW